MPDRIANIVILVEDVEQQNLIFRFLGRCNPTLTYRSCRFERAAKRSGGSGEQFVRKQYPAEVKEHRRRIGKGTSALLVVMVDADAETTQRRAKQLADSLETASIERRGNKEAIVVLIPKRHVETWIHALVGEQVNEEDDYKYPEPTPKQIHQAAETLYDWTRAGAQPSPTITPSLTNSIPEWQKIPS